MGWSDAPPEDDFAEDLYFVEGLLLISKYNFDAVWSSNLERANRTAKFFAKLNKISSHVKTDELNEVDYGLLTNKRKKWAENHFPKHKKDPDFVYPKGESFRQMQSRCVNYIEKQKANCMNDTVLLVVHAGVIRGLVCHYLQLPYAENLKRRIGHRYIGVLEVKNDGDISYDEIGESSDFVSENILSIPLKKHSSGE